MYLFSRVHFNSFKALAFSLNKLRPVIILFTEKLSYSYLIRSTIYNCNQIFTVIDGVFFYRSEQKL
jgi:hypothetical protein